MSTTILGSVPQPNGQAEPEPVSEDLPCGLLGCDTYRCRGHEAVKVGYYCWISKAPGTREYRTVPILRDGKTVFVTPEEAQGHLKGGTA